MAGIAAMLLQAGLNAGGTAWAGQFFMPSSSGGASQAQKLLESVGKSLQTSLPNNPIILGDGMTTPINRPDKTNDPLLDVKGEGGKNPETFDPLRELGEFAASPGAYLLNNQDRQGGTWLDGQRIAFVLLGLILIAVGIAWIAAPKALDGLDILTKLRAYDTLGSAKRRLDSDAPLVATEKKGGGDKGPPSVDFDPDPPRPNFGGDIIDVTPSEPIPELNEPIFKGANKRSRKGSGDGDGEKGKQAKDIFKRAREKMPAQKSEPKKSENTNVFSSVYSEEPRRAGPIAKNGNPIDKSKLKEPIVERNLPVSLPGGGKVNRKTTNFGKLPDWVFGPNTTKKL